MICSSRDWPFWLLSSLIHSVAPFCSAQLTLLRAFARDSALVRSLYCACTLAAQCLLANTPPILNLLPFARPRPPSPGLSPAPLISYASFPSTHIPLSHARHSFARSLFCARSITVLRSFHYCAALIPSLCCLSPQLCHSFALMCLFTRLFRCAHSLAPSVAITHTSIKQ